MITPHNNLNFKIMYYIENYNHFAQGTTKQNAIDNLAKFTLAQWEKEGYTKGFDTSQEFANYKGYSFAYIVEANSEVTRDENNGLFYDVNGKEYVPEKVCLA